VALMQVSHENVLYYRVSIVHWKIIKNISAVIDSKKNESF
jgi:hypothetical protein